MVVDTSVVVEAIVPNTPTHDACAELFQALSDAGTTIVAALMNRLESHPNVVGLFREEISGGSWSRPPTLSSILCHKLA